jgi:DNA polymerase-4
MSRLVMHVDLDAFFAAVEQRDNPPWRGLPLVVGAEPGRRGVVATCSYEARRYGVHSAMPISEAARRLPPETVSVRPSMNRYARVSRQIMEVLETISPLVEKVSIDEAYLDVTGLERLMGPPEVIGRLTKERIREAVGLTASVGIGPNRLIAKLASDADKPDGLTVVPLEKVSAFLDPMPLSVLRGVGAKTAPRLERPGLKTVGDVRHLSLEALRRHLGAGAGTQVHLQALGIADDHVYPASERKSISKETTFGEIGGSVTCAWTLVVYLRSSPRRGGCPVPGSRRIDPDRSGAHRCVRARRDPGTAPVSCQTHPVPVLPR